MKRRGLELTDDDFSLGHHSYFSRKSRRLDGDFLPIQTVPQALEQTITGIGDVQQNVPMTEAIPFSDDKALVLYNAPNTPIWKCPSAPEVSLSINPNWIPILKERYNILWRGRSDKEAPMEEDVVAPKNIEESNYSRAVVPWIHPLSHNRKATIMDLTEAMEVEMMDMEEDNTGSSNNNDKSLEGKRMVNGNEGLEFWLQQQQQYIATELPQNTWTPVTW